MKDVLIYRLRHTDFKFYGLSFFLGFGIYSLKLISLKKIIDTLNLEHYPLLMIACGLFIAGFNFTVEKIFTNKNLLVLFSFVLPVSVLLLAYIPNPYPIVSTISIFLLSTVAISLLDSSAKLILNKNISILKNPNISNRLTLMEELGLLVAALSTWLFMGSSKEAHFILNLVPFLGLILTNEIIKSFSHHKEEIYVEAKQEPISQDKKDYPFVIWLIGAISLTLILKQVQGFAVFLGIEQLKNEGHSVESVFALLNIVQTILIFSYLFYTSINNKLKLTWNLGYKIGFGVQSALLFMMTIIPNPFMYLFTGSARKVLQHSIINPSSTILNAALPEDLRFELKNKSEIWGNLLSYFVLGLVSYGILNLKFHASFMWAGCFIISCLGFYFRKNLFRFLAEFHLPNIDKTEEYEAASSAYSLATPEAKEYTHELIVKLQNQENPMVKKALIYTLGEVQEPEAAKKLIDEYANADREDIQFCIIQSLLKFESHHLDLFLLENLEAIITTQVSLGEIRKNVLKAITSRVSHIAIPSILKILKNRNHEPRIIANAIIVLGEIAENNQDESLYDFLFLYTNEKFPRRIRSNAMIYLSRNTRFKKYSNEFFESLAHSLDEYDRSALAFLAGELKLSKYHHFVLENSELKNHQNSTLLIALLKLHDFSICDNLAQIMISPDQNIAITAINQLSAIEDSLLRYKTYYFILNFYPESYHYFVELLKLSKRDFDSDLRLLQSEAKRLGIKDLDIENTDGVISLKNAA